MEKAIIVDHISYLNELNDVSFTLQKGEFVGIIGDSSRSNTLELISGLLKPNSGFISVLGYDPCLRVHAFLKQISYMKEQRYQLLKGSPAIKTLEVTKEIYGLSDREFNKNLIELTQFIKDANLIDALIYKPEVLLLDNYNLDLESVYNYNKKYGSTILINSDKIDNLINLVRRVILIEKGQVLFDGAIDEIISKYGKEKIIKAKLSSTVDEKSVAELGTVRKYEYPYIYVSSPRSVISFTAAELIQNFPITKLDIEELSIEEIVENIKHDI
ncbi:MAG: hypothetical protein ACD_19C00429G0013 [uncultured bacterium]|nr:MAG: hypothetical protein ACD_19C00429G0013 [uncultured bacterium]